MFSNFGSIFQNRALDIESRILEYSHSDHEIMPLFYVRDAPNVFKRKMDNAKLIKTRPYLLYF
jgi:hypothetical protein